MTTQQRTALDKANQHRMVQAGLKRSLRDLSLEEGKRVAMGVIRDPAPELGAMKLEALLRAVHAVGPHKASAICRRARVLPFRRLNNLNESECDRLERVLL